MKSAFFSRFRKRSNSNLNLRRRSGEQKRKLLLQSLEERRVLTLLGVAPQFPILFSNSTGNVSYEASSDSFSADATPLTFQPSFFGFTSFIEDVPQPPLPDGSAQPDLPRTFELDFSVDDSGNFAGGITGDDFTLFGAIDIDFDGVHDVSGVLLTGEVLDFGFADGATGNTDFYDLRLAVTGGELATAGTLSLGGARPAYFDGLDIGMTITSENSSFANSFSADFGGGNKATVGPIEPDNNNPPSAELGNFVWVDTNYDGIQNDGPTGVNDVTVNLYQDVDGDGIAEPGGDDGSPIRTTTTATFMGEDGYYLFEELEAGNYFVEFDTSTLPSGFQLTLQDAGGNDELDSDADTITGLTIVTELVDGESDLTWDAGINQVVNPAINIVKYVDKIVETSNQICIDFDELATGEIVATQYPGVVISGKSNSRPTAGNAAMIFDSANPSGGDVDLGTPNVAYGGPGHGSGGASNDTALGKILILSEDGDSADPDDDAQGGDITFTFDSPVTVDHLDVLDIDSNESGGSIITVTTTSGTQTISIPTAGNNSAQRIMIGLDDVTSMTVEFVSSGAITELCYTEFSSEKQWFDANNAPGVEFNVGEPIEFSYHVTNPGDVELVPVILVDDNATPGNTADDFNPVPVESVPGINDGDTDADGRLDPGEEWLYTASITAAVAGQFQNIGVVSGTPVNPDGDVIGDDVTDDDPANYSVIGIPGIDIEKYTNGIQADDDSEAVEIAAGDTVTWTYEVTNTGSTTFAANDIVVVDDSGTPGDTSDDFHPTLNLSTDSGSDGLLSPGETWIYEYSDVAQSVVAAGSTETVYLTGSSPTDGTNGNVRTFSAGGVTVNASAFSRDSSGTWNDAYLGVYGSGLGVTDRSEGNGGNGQHRVDNIGRLNYVLLEFSERVVVDAAFLDSVIGDSDLSVWIGDSADLASSGLALSDSVLSGFGFNESSMTSNDASRWANFNDAGVAGNVLVLAAWVDDSSPEDCFKIRKVKFQTIGQGVYGNIGTVSVEDVTDSDPSHYTNPAPTPSGAIGSFVWNDLDRDGKQDAEEPGVSGVNVNLLDASGTQIASTTTDGNGGYEFNGLEGGDYRVAFELPSDFVFTRMRSGISDGIDSDANRSTGLSHLITLNDHEIDHSVDAGIYEAAVDVMFEAEHFEWKDSPWRVKCDSDASGNKYIVAPNRTGSHYNSPPDGKKVMYRFNVDMEGRYELSALLRAKNGRDNSVWFRVDGGGWKQWHTPVTGYDYQWHAATDGWNNDSVAFNLDSGQHTLEIKVREDGTRFDKFMVSKLATTTVVIDAMDTSLNSSWTVDVDDDGNEFLVATGGTHYHTPPSDGELSYNFTLDQAGTFDMYALVSAANSGDNSIWIQIDGGDWIEWHLDVTGEDAFNWQKVTDGSGRNNVNFNLDAGQHTLKLKVREDGTKIDKIVISDDQFIDLSGY